MFLIYYISAIILLAVVGLLKYTYNEDVTQRILAFFFIVSIIPIINTIVIISGIATMFMSNEEEIIEEDIPSLLKRMDETLKNIFKL